MARNIEEFLRKAAERRQQQKGGQQPPPQQPQPTPPSQPTRSRQEPVIIDDVEVVQPRRPVNRPQPPRQQPPRQQPPRQQQPAKHGIRSGSVADHVKHHIDTSDISEHAANLGERISGVHDQVDKQIRSRLDHDLTEIDDTPTITDDPSPAIFGKRSSVMAGDIRKLLQNPKSVGQAIIIAEILKRPEI